MNDKYGIELDLIINKFKEKMQSIKSAFTGIKDQKINVNANTAQLNYLKSQIEEIEYLLNRADKGYDVGDTLKLEAKLERLKKQYNKIALAQKNVKNSANGMANSLDKGLSKVTSKIKRFGLSLLGIRSIFSLVSRASSAYLSQDTELTNKLQSVWAGLGAMLAPIIEGITNILAKAVKYINIFIKALTGVDLLARATSKSLGSMAKNAKASNKALAGFDELTNLDTSAGSEIDAGGLSGLNDVEIDTTWADRIRQFGEWVKANKSLIIGMFVGIGTAIAAIKIANFIKTIAGLNPIVAGISTLIAGIVITIKGIINYLRDPSWSNFIMILGGIALAVTGVALLFGGIPALITAIIGIIAALGLAVYKHWDEIKQTLSNVGKWIYDNVIRPVGDFFANLWENIKNSFQGAWNWILNAFSKGGQIFSGLKDGIVNVFKTIVNALIKGINKIIATPFNTINGLLNKIRSVDIFGVKPFEGFWGYNPLPVPQIPQLAVGTNYVPEDQLAYIHKGEAVVPKKFNSQEYFGNNEETNSLLREVINAVNNIEINPYTTVKDVGKASLQYINTRSRQLGESVVV